MALKAVLSKVLLRKAVDAVNKLLLVLVVSRRLHSLESLFQLRSHGRRDARDVLFYLCLGLLLGLRRGVLGNGLGNLLNESRGKLDYGMIWTVATTSVLVAVVITQLIGLVERLVDRRV